MFIFKSQKQIQKATKSVPDITLLLHACPAAAIKSSDFRNPKITIHKREKV